MKTRSFGKTGTQISPIGFGCMRLPEIKQEDGTMTMDYDKCTEMLTYAYEHGIDYFDTAPYYCNKNSEIAVGRAIKPFRDQVLLSTKLPSGECQSQDDYFRFLENSLKKLDTDHVDFYHFWATNKDVFDNKIVKLDLLNAARRAKEQGMIRHISFSFHDAPSVIRHIIDTAEAAGVPMETMLCQYNLIDRSNEEMIAYAHEHGLGTVAMGPVGGGRLSAPTDLYAKLTGKPSVATYELAFRFCLGNPNLSCALSGMQTLDMVKQNVAVAEKESEFSEEEWKTLGEALEQLKKFSELYCTGCRYCQPCPAGIDIPAIFEAYTYYNVYGLTGEAKNRMRHYVDKGGKCYHTDCKNCGMCEKKCPQHLEIRSLLNKVEGILLDKQ